MGGISDYAKLQAATALFPNGTNRYIGLLTSLPTDDDGTGLVEATGSGYARKAHSSWTTATDGETLYALNNGAVSLTALTADLADIIGWAIWDAASGGNLYAWGPLLDVGGNEITKTFTSGNQPNFPDAELKIGVD